MLNATNDWQPIETAPKDGTPIDVWLGNAEQSDIDFYCNDGTKRSTGWSFRHGQFRPAAVGVPSLDRITVFVEPTHWMPLPEPPRDK
jgi:hypothetical protein